MVRLILTIIIAILTHAVATVELHERMDSVILPALISLALAVAMSVIAWVLMGGPVRL